MSDQLSEGQKQCVSQFFSFFSIEEIYQKPNNILEETGISHQHKLEKKIRKKKSDLEGQKENMRTVYTSARYLCFAKTFKKLVGVKQLEAIEMKITHQKGKCQKSFQYVFLMLAYIFGPQRRTLNQHQILAERVYEEFEIYIEENPHSDDFQKELKGEVKRVLRAMEHFFSHECPFEGIEKSITISYDEKKAKKGNKGDSANKKEKCIEMAKFALQNL